MRQPLFTAFALFAFVLAPVSEAHAAGMKLTWAECVRLARDNNSLLKSSHASLDAARAQTKSRYSAFLPELLAESGYSRSGERLRGADPVTNPEGYSSLLMANVNLFNGFADMNRLEEGRQVERLARTSLVTSNALVLRDLKVAFASLAFAERSVDLARAIIKRREQNLDLVRLRFENGNENKGSLLLSQSYMEEARLNLLTAEQDLTRARSELARILGMDGEHDLSVAGELPLATAPLSVDFPRLAAELPEREQAVINTLAKEASVRAARGNFFPRLILEGSVGRWGTDFYPDRPDRHDERWTVALKLQFPLFSGWRDVHGLESARAELSAAEHARHGTERELLVRLKSLHAAYVQAEAREKVDVGFLEAAKVRSEIGRAKYNNGLMSFDDWDNIENDLIGRERGALASVRDRAVAEANWEQLLGKGL